MFPTAFTFVSRSPTNLSTRQGVAFNADLTRFWGFDGVPGSPASHNTIYEYDAAHNLLATSGTLGVAHGLPAGTTQINGSTFWPADGKLYCGYNNFPTGPRLGGIIVVDPSDITTVEAVHPASNGHTEGCAIRNTARGPEAFVFSNTNHTIERYDLATWTLQGSHPFGYWAVADADARYQGGGWIGDVLCLTLHGNQTRPPTIDACVWDDDALEFTPLYRLGRPTIHSAQGFGFFGSTLAFFAERNNTPNPDQFSIARVGVSSVAELPYQTPNVSSSQLDDLQYWYQRLTWDASGPEWQLVDTQGNGATGTGFDETRVYLVPASDGTRKIRFDGSDGSGIALGDLFGAGGWAEATIWFRGVVVHRNDANDTLLSWDASGSNAGDGAVEVNRDAARSVSFRYGATTLTSAGNVFTLGVAFDLCVQLTVSGARIYVDGVEVATNATSGQIGGANQDVFLGSDYQGQLGAQFDVWDVRLYDAVKDPNVLATFDMWAEEEEPMGTLSTPARTALVGHWRNKAAYTPAATHYAHAYAGGVAVSDAPVAFDNDGTSYDAPAARAVALAILLDFDPPTTNWGDVDEIRITDNATPGAGLEIGRHTLDTPVAIGVALGEGGAPTGPLRVTGVTITAPAGGLADDEIHDLLGLMCGAVANSPRTSTWGVYGTNATTEVGSRVEMAQDDTHGPAANGRCTSVLPITIADQVTATHWLEYDAAAAGNIIAATALPAVPSGGVIPAGGLRTSFT